MPSGKTCLYCGRQQKLTREHIVPEALGGTRWIRAVCKTCNNRFLSKLDKELSSASPVSIIAAEEMHKTTGYTWEVDHSENNLLIEAQADTAASSMIVWPQIVFDEESLQLRADAEEIQQFGTENFGAVFTKHLLRAYHTLRTAKRPRFVFERVPDKIPSRYRYPPRVFASRQIRDFDNRMHFRCRYLMARDKQRVRKELDNWRQDTRFRRTEFQIGSALPAVHFHYEMQAVVRCLIKIAINMLRFVCKSTKVDREHFGDAVRVVTGEHRLSESGLRNNGLVRAKDLAPFNCPVGSHVVRLQGDTGRWVVWFAFFGGRVGATVRFPGPNYEPWRTADVTIPVNSRDWDVHKSCLLRPLRTHVAWKQLEEMIPSIAMVNTRSVETVIHS